MSPPIEIRRGFGELELASLKPGQFVTASGLRDGGYIVWEKASVSAETAAPTMPDSYDGNPLSYAECSKHGPYDIREIRCPKCVKTAAPTEQEGEAHDSDGKNSACNHVHIGIHCERETGSATSVSTSAAPTGGQDGRTVCNGISAGTGTGIVPDGASSDCDSGSGEATGAALEPGSANYIIEGEDKYLLRKDGSRIGPTDATECEMQLWAYASKLRAEIERLKHDPGHEELAAKLCDALREVERLTLSEKLHCKLIKKLSAENAEFRKDCIQLTGEIAALKASEEK